MGILIAHKHGFVSCRCMRTKAH